jgi:hypothetical protein
MSAINRHFGTPLSAIDTLGQVTDFGSVNWARWSSISVEGIEVIPITGQDSFRTDFVIGHYLHALTIVWIKVEEVASWFIITKLSAFLWSLLG